MIIHRAHKIKLSKLSSQQKSYLLTSAGASRFAYNWGLAEWKKRYEDYTQGKTKTPPNAYDLRKLFNARRKIENPSNYDELTWEQQREYFHWVTNVSKCIPQQALINLGTAYQRFFKKTAKAPRFKRKGQDDSFYVDNENAKVIKKEVNGTTCFYLSLPKIDNDFLLTEEPRFQGKLLSVTVSRHGESWYAALSYELEIPDPVVDKKRATTKIGIDLGIKHFAVMVDHGEVTFEEEGPKALKRLLGRLRLLNRRLSKKVKCSKNFEKAKLKISALHFRISNIRKDFQHKLSTDIVQHYHQVGMETLNVKGMLKNHKLSRHISDAGWYQFKMMIKYKLLARGGILVEADQFFASTKTMSCCDVKLEHVTLSDRTLTCPSCGIVHDRDINSARNLRDIG